MMAPGRDPVNPESCSINTIWTRCRSVAYCSTPYAQWWRKTNHRSVTLNSAFFLPFRERLKSAMSCFTYYCLVSARYWGESNQADDLPSPHASVNLHLFFRCRCSTFLDLQNWSLDLRHEVLCWAVLYVRTSVGSRASLCWRHAGELRPGNKWTEAQINSYAIRVWRLLESYRLWLE